MVSLAAGFILLWLVWELPRIRWQPFSPPLTPPVWGEKAVLGYFALTPSLSEGLLQSEVMDVYQFKTVQEIARWEVEQLRALEQESEVITQDTALSLPEKRARIAEMGYNQRVERILKLSQVELQKSIQPATYMDLVSWIEEQWKNEVQTHGLAAPRANPRTFEIFATRYDSKGAYTVALPDKCLKFANAGNHVCDEDGYATGQDYTVFLSYKKSAAARVLEAGPWNVDDNYWSRSNDPQPRRMFRDLGLGMPEAQAAYFNGYNGGLDQFGRKVTAPFGIDLGRQVSIDIGLQPGVNDWITVSFMWTDGWNSASSSMPGGSPVQGATQAAIQPIETSTPNPDGSLIHTVKAGQTLWNIAAVYGVSLQDLLSLNGLNKDALIFPGEKLIVRLASESPSPSSPPPRASSPPGGTRPTSTLSPINDATISSLSSSTPTWRLLNSATPQFIGGPEVDSRGQNQSGIDPLLVAILGLLVVGVGLVLVGTLVKHRP